jgi:2-succinyl-5-enolpyruvyl-6-hydroxy-3-cyclohexene-1-carboxylate synthase
VIAHYDVLLRVEPFADAHRPDLVLRVGDTPTSKPLRALLAASRQVVLDPHTAWHEPTRGAELLLHAAAAPACDALAAALEMRTSERDAGWLESWRRADALVPGALAEAPDPFEPKVLASIEPALPAGATVWVGSSMPIRDVEAYFPQTDKPIRFLSNRGANGIDGVVASAAGTALAAGGRGWLLTGELALLHDLGGLLAARRAGAELTIVCLDNGGGSIFDFLPVAEAADGELYERHIATPADVEFEQVADLAGIPYTDDVTEPGLVVVRTDRATNVRLHREVVERVAAALR